MKPFDGGAWVGVSRIRDAQELNARYDCESGRRLMHLQAAVDGFDVFARSLSVGAETMVMRFEPDRPLHDHYQVEHDFLDEDTGREVVTIGRTVNAFFRWEFNSLPDADPQRRGVCPIDYANACPDMSLISLHYYFPWAIKALLRWCICAPWASACAWRSTRTRGSRPPMRTPLRGRRRAYRRLADDHFESSATRSCARAISPTSTRPWRATSTHRPSTRCSSTP